MDPQQKRLVPCEVRNLGAMNLSTDKHLTYDALGTIRTALSADLYLLAS